ncbi:MAG: aromatic ring-hydroxylating dioxygenase subunit alpha [Steroidobacteraceae bacterium]|jgi:phenylpropionate dioxygenase-like ring-hydroxylating dioxygenase large terminal subunit|nr:aromatic ring-hydroxylating dioxygenase subunit alpha [Steroidobacteraceae bacterium]
MRSGEAALSQLFVTRNWYVAATSSELRSEPLGRMICGRRMALFRDAGGRPHAVSATCPHRGADLARGRVVGSSLECPFHGLCFDGAGACTRIPSQDPGAPIPRALRVPSFAVAESHGLVWIWPEPDDQPPHAPEVPEFLGLPAPWRLSMLPGGRLCSGSYLNSLENALDDAHLAFVHKRTVPGASERVAPFRIEIAPDRRGYWGIADMADIIAQDPAVADVSAGGGLLEDLLGRFAMEQLTPVQKSYRYHLSGNVCITTTDASGPRDHTFAFFTPSDAEQTLLFGGVLRNHSLNPVADWLFARYMPALTSEDAKILGELVPEARGPGGLARPFVIRADRQSFPFRRIYGDALAAEGKPVPWALDGAGAAA